MRGKREMESGQGFGEVDLTAGFLMSWETASGSPRESEVGVGGEQESGWREFFKEQRLFGPIRAAESDQGVRRG